MLISKNMRNMHHPGICISSIYVILLSCQLANGQIGDILTIAQYGWQMLNLNDKLLLNRDEMGLKVQEISSQIQKLQDNLIVSQTTIINEMKYFMKRFTTENEFITSGNKIDFMFTKFHEYLKNGSEYEDDTIEDFARAATSHSNNELTSLLDSMHRLAVPAEGPANSLFHMLIENRETKHDAAQVCGSTISLQQEIYRLYNLFALYIVKGHIIQMYGYVLLKKFRNKDFQAEKKGVRKQYQRMILGIEKIARDVISRASRDIRPCDAENPVEGKDYIQLKWLFNPVVINEEQLSRDAESCKETCYDYNGISTDWIKFNRPLDQCQGKLYQCFFSHVNGYCPAWRPYRRYEGFLPYEPLSPWFERAFPARGNASCDVPLPLWEPLTEPTRVLHGCDDCICWCDEFERKDTVRTFSTRMVRANTKDNRVITGIKLVERGRVIYIQIQEGKLSSNGIIDASTIAWQDIDEFDYTSFSTLPGDYFTIKNYDNSIFFDAIFGRPGQVLTGIGFARKDFWEGDWNRPGISMKIEVTEFNLRSGVMNNDNTEKIEVADRNWNRLKLTDPDIPTTNKFPNVVNTNDDVVLGFRQSDWNKDVGETPIPFIDSQPIISDPPSPLSGAGMFHKGRDGLGGFLGMKLVSYDISELMVIPKLTRKTFSVEYSTSALEFKLPELTQFWGIEPFKNQTLPVYPKYFDFRKHLK